MTAYTTKNNDYLSYIYTCCGVLRTPSYSQYMLSIFYYLYCTQRTHIPSNSCLVNIKITELCKQNKTPKNKNNKKKNHKKTEEILCVHSRGVV